MPASGDDDNKQQFLSSKKIYLTNLQ